MGKKFEYGCGPVDINAVTATFHVLVNTYFLNFRLALLTVLRALAHLIYIPSSF